MESLYILVPLSVVRVFIIGAVIFSIIPYYLSLDPNVRILIFSAAIILIMTFAPGGLHQIATRLFERVKGGRGERDAT